MKIGCVQSLFVAKEGLAWVVAKSDLPEDHPLLGASDSGLYGQLWFVLTPPVPGAWSVSQLPSPPDKFDLESVLRLTTHWEDMRRSRMTWKQHVAEQEREQRRRDLIGYTKAIERYFDSPV